MPSAERIRSERRPRRILPGLPDVAGGGSGAMVTVQDGKMVPIPFATMRTAEGRTRVRNVDPASPAYRVAREYMLRLEPEDFSDPAWVERLAEAGATTADELRTRFAGGR